jgi:hypothetical protein
MGAAMDLHSGIHYAEKTSGSASAALDFFYAALAAGIAGFMAATGFQCLCTLLPHLRYAYRGVAGRAFTAPRRVTAF